MKGVELISCCSGASVPEACSPLRSALSLFISPSGHQLRTATWFARMALSDAMSLQLYDSREKPFRQARSSRSLQLCHNCFGECDRVRLNRRGRLAQRHIHLDGQHVRSLVDVQLCPSAFVVSEVRSLADSWH